MGTVLIKGDFGGCQAAPSTVSIAYSCHMLWVTKHLSQSIVRTHLYAKNSQVSERPLPLDAIISVFTTLVAFPVQLQLLAGHLPAMGAAPTDLMVFYGAGDTASFALRMPLGNLSLYL